MLTRRFARALLFASIVTATQNFCDDSIRNHTVVILFVGANQDDPTFQLLRCAAVRSAVRVARRRLPKFAVRTLFVSHDRNRTVPGAHFDAVLDAPRALDVATVAVARYEHVRAMLDAVSLGAAYAVDDMCAGWVWRVRLEMLVGAFDLPDDPDAAACYGYRNQFAGKMVSDNLLFGTAATVRRMFAPHDWDPAAPPDPTILERFLPSPDFKNGPEALMEARVGSRVCGFAGQTERALCCKWDRAPRSS